MRVAVCVCFPSVHRALCLSVTPNIFDRTDARRFMTKDCGCCLLSSLPGQSLVTEQSLTMSAQTNADRVFDSLDVEGLLFISHQHIVSLSVS